jgi:hypothetical protein
MQGSALTLGAAAMKSLLLPLSENRAGLCSGSVEVQSGRARQPVSVSLTAMKQHWAKWKGKSAPKAPRRANVKRLEV